MRCKRYDHTFFSLKLKETHRLPLGDILGSPVWQSWLSLVVSYANGTSNISMILRFESIKFTSLDRINKAFSSQESKTQVENHKAQMKR